MREEFTPYLPKNPLDAELAGSLFYFPEVPCAQKHLAPRYTKTRRCVQCTKEACLKGYLEKAKDKEFLKARAEKQKEIRRKKVGIKKIVVAETSQGRTFNSIKEAAAHYGLYYSIVWQSIKRGSVISHETGKLLFTRSVARVI